MPGLPADHFDHFEVNVDLEVVDEPFCHFSHRKTMAHHHRSGADETFLSRKKKRALDRAASRVWPVQHPDTLARSPRLLEHVEQCRDKGVDAATQVLQIEQEDIGARHHLSGRAANLSVEAEYGDPVLRVGFVRGLDHVVLLVAFQTVLRTEGGGDVHPAIDQRIERMIEARRNRRRMGNERNPLVLEGLAKFIFCNETIDAEFHVALGGARRAVKQAGS